MNQIENQLVKDLIKILQYKVHGIMSFNEVEQVENYLQLHNKSESELVEIRNKIVSGFWEEQDKIKVYQDEKNFIPLDKDKFWLLDDVMSASVMVIDSKLYDL